MTDDRVPILVNLRASYKSNRVERETNKAIRYSKLLYITGSKQRKQYAKQKIKQIIKHHPYFKSYCLK